MLSANCAGGFHSLFSGVFPAQIGKYIVFTAADMSFHGFFGSLWLMVPDIFQDLDVFFRRQAVMFLFFGDGMTGAGAIPQFHQIGGQLLVVRSFPDGHMAE